MIPWPLVRVTWIDSTGPHGWTRLHDAVADHSLIIESIGWLIEDKDERVTIAAHIAMSGVPDGNPSVDGVLTIPRVTITELQEWELKG